MDKPMGQHDFMPDGETPPEMPDGEFFPGGFGPQGDFEPADGELPPDGFGGFDPQHGRCSGQQHRWHPRRCGYGPRQRQSRRRCRTA